MAQAARDERQAMRHRGAENRKVNNADFDLNFAAGSREERRLMRQRGAGNREVNNIDFGFAFATPSLLAGRRSRTKSNTPGATARTPLRNNGDSTLPPAVPPSGARSRETQHAPSVASESSRNQLSTKPQRKRRRLSEVSNITQATSLDIPLASDLDNRDESSFVSPQHVPDASSSAPEKHRQNFRFDIPSSPLFVMDHASEDLEANKENVPAPSRTTVSMPKKRKRKSIGQQSLFKKKRSSGASYTSVPTPPPVEEGQATNAAPSTPSEPASASEPHIPSNGSYLEVTPVSPSVNQSQHTVDVPLSRKTTRKKKRKSIVGGKRRKRSNDTMESSKPKPIPPMEGQYIEEDVRMRDGESWLNLSGDTEEQLPHSASQMEVPTRDNAKRTWRLDMRDEEDADETYVPDEATPDPTPAPKRVKERQNSGVKTQAKKSSTRVNGRKPKGSFPILTHRMTNAHTLPTIVEETETDPNHENRDSSTDELSLAPPPNIVTRSTPNAVDVLAQACRETIDASIQRIKENSSALSRADISRQTTALQTFKSNLDIRLFDLSQSLDQRLHMEARLRKSRREKSELQAQWLGLRKQRDLMALRMDAVRRQHWEDELLSCKTWDISQAAHRLDTSVNRDDGHVEEETKADSLEFSLKELSQDISSKDRGGILNVLKHFNARLEQAASVLN